MRSTCFVCCNLLKKTTWYSYSTFLFVKNVALHRSNPLCFPRKNSFSWSQVTPIIGCDHWIFTDYMWKIHIMNIILYKYSSIFFVFKVVMHCRPITNGPLTSKGAMSSSATAGVCGFATIERICTCKGSGSSVGFLVLLFWALWLLMLLRLMSLLFLVVWVILKCC